MVIAESTESVPVPKGVNVTLTGATVKVKGPNGELVRTLRHPLVSIKKEGDNVVVHADFPRKKTKALVGTYAAHLRNMVKGAEKDWEYKMKIVYAHFPIKVKVTGDKVTIDNFLGEKTPRKAKIMKGAKVKATAEEVVVTGADIEAVSQTAANIEQACRVRGYDIRVFQDGIYITNKGA